MTTPSKEAMEIANRVVTEQPFTTGRIAREIDALIAAKDAEIATLHRAGEAMASENDTLRTRAEKAEKERDLARVNANRLALMYCKSRAATDAASKP